MRAIPRLMLPVFLAATFLAVTPSPATASVPGANACVPAGSGTTSLAPTSTFVMPDTLQTTTGDAMYQQSDWNALVRSLHTDGFTDIIVQDTAKNVRQADGTYRWDTFFPDTDSSGDVYSPARHQPDHDAQLGEILSAAQSTGMTVTIGLGLDEDAWYGGSWDDPAAMTAQASTATRAASAIAAQYGRQYGSTIAGWYLPFEVEGSWLGDGASLAGIEHAYVDDYLRPVSAAVHALTPTGTVLVSPFFVGLTQDPTGTAEQTRLANWTALWNDVLTTTDVTRIAPQDGRGAGSNSLADVTRWTAATATAAAGVTGASVWGNAEAYRDENTGVNEMPVSTLAQDLAAMRSGGATGLVTFSAVTFDIVPGHAGASSTSRQAFVAAYREWRTASTCPARTVDPPTGLRATAGTNGAVALDWTAATSSSTDPARTPDVTAVVRDGRTVAELPATTTAFTDSVPSGTTATYELVTEDAYGIDSVPSVSASVTMPQLDGTGTDLARGAPYAVTTAAPDVPGATGLRTASAPTTSGTDTRAGDPATDGALGTDDPTDPAWEGRFSAARQSWTLVVPMPTGGSTVRQVNTEWLQDGAGSIVAPTQVSVTATLTNGSSVFLGSSAEASGTSHRVVWDDVTASTELAGVASLAIRVMAPPGWTFLGEAQAFDSQGVDHALGQVTSLRAVPGFRLPGTTDGRSATIHPGTRPDSLTDGITGAGWAGWTAPSGTLYATLDLGAEEPVAQASADLLAATTGVSVRTADTGGTWSAWGPTSTVGTAVAGVHRASSPILATDARYVQIRLSVAPGSTVQLDELSVTDHASATATAGAAVSSPSMSACTASTCNATATGSLPSLVTPSALGTTWWDAGTPWALTNVDDPAQPGTHGVTVQVGFAGARTLRSVTSTWLEDRSAWLMLPRRVSVQYEDPSGTWYPLGTANAPAVPQELPATAHTAAYSVASTTPITAVAIRVSAADGSPYPWSAPTWSAIGAVSTG